MAAPNLVNVTSLFGKTTASRLTSSTSSILTCPANKVCKVNTVMATNIDTGNSSEVTMSYYNSSNTTSYSLSKQVPIPDSSTLIVIGKDNPIYLEEGDRIDASSFANDTIEVVISYEELDDA